MAAKNEGKATYGASSKKKPTPKKPSTPAKKPSGYDWGDGRAVHSIPVEEHNANKGGVATYGVTPNTPLDAPLTAAQGYAMAQAAANRTYAPQLQANAQLQANTPAWYQNYINRTGEAQKAAQTYAQPILDTAQTAVTNAGATTPGLDPSSPQYAKEQQAAQGRTTMAQDSANYLAGVAAATNAYFGGQANIAARDLPQAQAGLVYQAGQLGSQRQDAATAAYGDIRTNEQNASLARQTLGLNTTKAISDAASDAASLEQTAADRKAARVVSRKNTRDRVNATTRNQQTAADKAAAKEADKAKKDAAKKTSDVQKATGKIKSQVTNAKDAWERYARARNPVIDPKTKQPVPGKTIKATPDQIKSQLRKDGYTEAEIHAMLMIRAGKKLTPSDIQRLKDQDPNFRVPAEWRQKKSKTATQDADPHGTGAAPDRAPGGARGSF